jgi:NitT/TauT family transport system permease protein
VAELVAPKSVWEEKAGPAERPVPFGWIDALVLVGLAGLFFGLIDLVAQSFARHPQPALDISLSSWALPRYAFLSLARVLLAYLLALAFAVSFSYWMVKDLVAGRVVLPLVDFFQRSVPALGLMPALVVALATLFPGSNFGLELSALLVLFMGQVWPFATSFRHVLRLVPQEQQEMATAFRLSWWQRFRWVELPFTTISLVWNSMQCVARGWFVLVIAESFMLDRQDYRLPGIGSYMSLAVQEEDWAAVLWALAAMTLLIVALDQLVWQPLVVWSQKFRVEEAADPEPMTSWFLDWLRHGRLPRLARLLLRRWWPHGRDRPAPARPVPRRPAAGRSRFTIGLLLALLLPLAWGAWWLTKLLLQVSAEEWLTLLGGLALTFGRVVLATGLGVLWALPVGLAVGLSPRWSRFAQPAVQVLASFPAPLFFPLAALGLHALGVPMGWGSILLLFLATQSYLLFNVIAGALTIPTELKEAVHSYRLPLRQRFASLYLPAVFPYLMTGWDGAASAAWGTCVVAEYLTLRPGEVEHTWGIGAAIAGAAHRGDVPVLAAGEVLLCWFRYILDRKVWMFCRRLAEQRFALNK